MGYPDNCIKGIPNEKEFLIPDGSVAAHLFHFKPEPRRTDSRDEQSVNWEDDDSAVPFTLAQRKEGGERQFRGGVAILPRAEIDRINRRPTVGGILSYERQALPDNPYHGNILLRAGVPKPTMKKIAACLAVAVSRIVEPTVQE